MWCLLRKILRSPLDRRAICMKNIVIIGAGYLAREVCSYVKACTLEGQNWRLKGFLDDRTDALSGFNYSSPILSGVETYEPRDGDLFVCALGHPVHKEKYCSMIKAKGGRFATLVHPSAIVGDNVVMQEGALVGPLAVLTSDITIGKYAYVGPHCDVGHDSIVGRYTQLSGNVCLGGRVVVEDSVFMGLSVTVIPGVKLGTKCHIGAGSVVLKNVKPLSRVFGNPAVVIGEVKE